MNLEDRKIRLRELIQAHNRALEEGDVVAAKMLEGCFEEQLQLFRATKAAQHQNSKRSWSDSGDFSHVRSTGVILK